MEKQKTIKHKLTINGRRQSDGIITKVSFSPCRDGLFVKYKKQLLPVTPKIINLREKRHTNSIVVKGKVISMVEHIFSAVNGLGIDNIIIEFYSDEAPFFANSELIANRLKKNITTLNKEKNIFKINNELLFRGKNGQYCRVTPCNDFIVNITIDFDNIIGRQNFSYSYLKTDYLKDISFARSLLLFKIATGKNPWKNFKKHFSKFPAIIPPNPKDCPYIAYDSQKFITPLQDTLEPVKHKLLDFIGDLFFLGAIPYGKFEIFKPGHSFNKKIVKKLFKLKNKSDNITFNFFLGKIPEFNLMKKCIENNIVHKNESVFEHTKKVFNNADKLIKRYDIPFTEDGRLNLSLAVFLHDYGKKDVFLTDKNNITTCDKHEKISAQKIKDEKLLERFDLKNNDKIWITNFIANHAQINNIFSQNKNLPIKVLKRLKNKFNDYYLENLIFGIADLKDTYFKKYNNMEYKRRLDFLEKNLRAELSARYKRYKRQPNKK